MKFRSLNEAGRTLGIDPSGMSKYMKENNPSKPFRGKYLIKKV
jgi:hypothetical protein